jgi:hypothetical protein
LAATLLGQRRTNYGRIFNRHGAHSVVLSAGEQAPRINKGGSMDIIYVAISVVFFGVTGALIHLLSKL